MIPQPIIDIAEICARRKIENAVVSPGSRSAPLVIAFVRHPEIKTWVFPDERSAAYIACGMSAFTRKPTVVICTSGTAAYNLSPAIAEAFYQQIPLIVLTADRPPEWIDQYDNQTIRQNNMYGSHVKKSYSLPVSFHHPDDMWFCHRIVSEAINLSISGRQGPVHINVPLREPLYPGMDQLVEPSDNIKVIEPFPSNTGNMPGTTIDLRNEWEKYGKKLIVAGHHGHSPEITASLQALNEQGVAVAGDITSNLHQSPATLRRHDIFLNSHNQKAGDLRPELLITWGKTILSKNLKEYLRKHKPVAHWHVQNEGPAPDTFQSVTKVIHMDPEIFFESIAEFPGDHAYLNKWYQEEARAEDLYRKFISKAPFGEFKAVDLVLKSLPDFCHLHLANSMSVRYANFAGLDPFKKGVLVFSNRGTSGIDGCSSFATGSMLASGNLTVLVTGDLAFFYDRNAFWHNYPMDNLRIVLLNNHGGLIFRIIDGPNRQPELEEYFETRQKLNAFHTAADFGFDYFNVKDEEELQVQLKTFYERNGRPKILEIEFKSTGSKEVFDQFKHLIREEYETQLSMGIH